MNPVILAVELALAIGIIIIGSVKFKLNAAISMVIAALFMGVINGLPAADAATTVASGFGNMMTGIGLPVGFGIILGQLLAVTGSAQVIADGILGKFKGDKAVIGISFAAMVLSIPVFFDIVFIILLPISIAISKRLKLPLPYVIGSLALGTALGHSLIPPTPAPLAAPDILNFDVGTMFIIGLGISLITIIVSNIIWKKVFYGKGYWNVEKDQARDVVQEIEEEVEEEGLTKKPSFFEAFSPILVSVLCILIGTVGTLLYGKDNVPVWMSFLGDKTVAMMLGALSAYVVGWKYLGKEKSEQAAEDGLKSAGTVLLVTGAGGCFGAILTEINIGEALVQLLGSSGSSTVVMLLFAYFVGFVLRVAQGSATVAGITSMQIMATVVAATTLHPVFIAIASLCGALSVAHVNDSGFWIITNMCGFNITGGFKTATMSMFISTSVAFIIDIILALVIPL